MNVRITPRRAPQRTDLYGGIDRVTCDGEQWSLHVQRLPWLVERALEHGHMREGPLTPPLASLARVRIPFRDVAEIALDEEPGDWF